MSRRQEVMPDAPEITQEEQPRTPSFPSAIPILSICAVLVVVLGMALWPRGQPATLPQPTVSVPIPTPTAILSSPTPSDAAIAPYVALIHAKEAVGRWDAAATEAENALTLPELSSSNRKILIGYAISDGVRDLYTQPFRPLDTKQQQAMIDRYLALKERANDAGVAIDTPLQVGNAAFSSSQFPLARVAIEEALKDGSFKPETDRDITKMYASTIYGIGKWNTTADKNSPLFQEGLSWLVASDRIAVKYQTGQSEAAMLLSQLGYPDKAMWPQPATTPLIETP